MKGPGWMRGVGRAALAAAKCLFVTLFSCLHATRLWCLPLHAAPRAHDPRPLFKTATACCHAVCLLTACPSTAGVSSSVSIPRPIPGLVASTVLVESFEAGRSVAVFMREPHAINTQIVALGVDAYLKMLLTDNFVHTDLHPGRWRLGVVGVGGLQPLLCACGAALQHGCWLVLGGRSNGGSGSA